MPFTQTILQIKMYQAFWIYGNLSMNYMMYNSV